tara:strand:+ start:927 stop:1100 length:174 start_codon:yes stop_codon:yes gene_type:complete
MKTTNSSSRIADQEIFKSENIKNLKKGITKTLLEKYKPKGIYLVDTLGEQSAQRGIA